MTSISQLLGDIEQAPDGPRVAAIFDFDGTLIAGYSILAIARETAEQGARRGKLHQATKVVQDILKHKVYRSGANYHRLVKRTTKALSGVSESTLRDIGENAYRKYLAKSLYREAVALVEAHRAAGHTGRHDRRQPRSAPRGGNGVHSVALPHDRHSGRGA